MSSRDSKQVDVWMMADEMILLVFELSWFWRLCTFDGTVVKMIVVVRGAFCVAGIL